MSEQNNPELNNSPEQDEANLKDRNALKERFSDGDIPTGNDFADLIDSAINQIDDEIYVDSKNIGVGTANPNAKFQVTAANNIDNEVTDTCGDVPGANYVAFRVETGDRGLYGQVSYAKPLFEIADQDMRSMVAARFSEAVTTDKTLITKGKFTAAADVDAQMNVAVAGDINAAGNVNVAAELLVNDFAQIGSTTSSITLDTESEQALLHINHDSEQSPLTVTNSDNIQTFNIDNAGRVAIGSNAASARLDINANDINDKQPLIKATAIQSIDGNDQVVDAFSVASDGKVAIGVSQAVNTLEGSGNSVIGGQYAGSQAAPQDGLLVEGDIRGDGRITAKTQLGVGTSLPSATFEVVSSEGPAFKVSSSANTEPALYVDGNNQIGINTQSPTTEFDVHAHSHFQETLKVSGATILEDTLAIGIEMASAKIHVDADAQQAALKIDQEGATKLTVAPDGNVGVGTDLPTKAFTVAGEMLVTEAVEMQNDVVFGQNASIAATDWSACDIVIIMHN